MSAASRFFFERKLVYPFAFVSFAASFCLCIVLFLKSGFYFFLRNKVVFPSSHPFPTAVGANLVCPQPKPLPRFSGKVPHTENGHRRTLCAPATPHACSLSAKPTFFQKNPARCASSAWHKTPLLYRLIFIKNVFLSYCPLLQTNFLSPKTDFLSAHFYETMSVIR